MKLTFATRPSALARWQTQHVIAKLQAAWPDLKCEEVVITTQGDRVLDKPLPVIGGKGLFTTELEQALLAGEVDAAVHSLKDLPTEDAPGLTVGAIPLRADVRDALICPAGHGLAQLPARAVVGTSSIRRQAQMLASRPDLQIQSIRGNVDTRIRKASQGQYDAIILAAAGVNRLGLEQHITQYFSLDLMLPAPGQGALGIQSRVDDARTRDLLAAIDHRPTHLAVTAERAFLAALGGGCSLPVGALASLEGERLRLQGVVAAPDGKRILRVSTVNQIQSLEAAQNLGITLAQEAVAKGAHEILAQLDTK